MCHFNSPLPLLRFTPRYQHPIWGGHRIRQRFGRGVADDRAIGESWEVFDLSDGSSTVMAGPLAGKTLSDILAETPAALMGSATPVDGRFPLMIKFIDAHQTLSVQVHPDSKTAWRLGGDARSKTEAWYVIDCDPGAELFVGFEGNMTPGILKAAVIAGTLERYLRRVPVKPGDFLFLPAGTVHAIGAGILLAEVQQPSNTTYRLFDWNRVDAAGRPRELHVSQALRAIHYDPDRSECATPPASGRPGLSCRPFQMELLTFAAGHFIEMSDDVPLVFLAAAGDGHVQVSSAGYAETLRTGESLLVPACLSGHIALTATGDISLLAIRPGH
jgi:mannose-6-phosphate isomerase